MTRIQLEKLQVHGLYGRFFDDLKLDDLSSRLTVVYGPNGSGKSSLASAASRLFSIGEKGVDGQIRARLLMEGQSRELDLNLLGASEQSTDWPQSPRPDLYRLSIVDLLPGPQDSDRNLLRQALQGGMDLEQLQHRSGRQPSLKPLQTLLDEVFAKRGEAAKLREQELALGEKERLKSEAEQAARDLPLLSNCLAALDHEAEAAAKSAEIALIDEANPGIDRQQENSEREIEAAWESLQSVIELRRADESKLQEYGGKRAPRPLQRVDGELVRKIATDSERLLGEGKHARDSQAAVSREVLIGAEALKSLSPGFDPDRPGASPSPEHRIRAHEADHACRLASERVSRAEERLQRAKKAREEAAAVFPGLRVPAQELYQALVRPPEVASLLDELRRVDAMKSGFEQAASRVRAAGLVLDGAQERERSIEALRDWLRGSPETAVSQGDQSLLPGIALAFLVAVGALAALQQALIASVLACAGFAVLGVLMVVREKRKASSSDDSSGRPDVGLRVSDEFAPVRWTVQEVVDSLVRALREHARTDAQKGVLLELESLGRSTDDGGRARKELDSRREEFRRLTGVELQPDYELALLVQRIVRLKDAEEELRLAENESTGASAHQADVQQKRQALLLELGGQAAGPAMEASAWLEQLAAFHRAKQAVSEAQARVFRVDAALEEIRAEVRRLMQEYGFDAPAEPLHSLRAFQEWFVLTEALALSEGRERQASARLEDTLSRAGVPEGPVLSDRVRLPAVRRAIHQRRMGCVRARDASRLRAAESLRLAGDRDQLHARLGLGMLPSREELEAKREELDRRKDTFEKLSGEIAQTRQLLDRYAETANLAGSERSLHSEISQLDRWLSRKVEEVAMDAVTASIGDAFKKEARPELIRRANEWLERLTQGRYRFPDQMDDELSVIDGRDDSRLKGIDSLSTGAKVHLALSIRLAVIEASEKGGYRFPLLLDEAMAASDPEATRAIAGVIGEITGQRQVILFTNQPDDIQVIRDVLGLEVPVRSIRGEPPLHARPEVLSLPASSTPSAAALPIASAIGQWPPAYLRDLLPELDPTAFTVDAACVRLEGSFRKKAETWVSVIEAVRSAAAASHRRVQPHEVEGQPWVSKTFAPQILKVLSDCRGEPREFLEGVRAIPRIRKETKEDCEAWLQENGYLGERESLSALAEIALRKLPEDTPHRASVALGIASFFRDFADR